MRDATWLIVAAQDVPSDDDWLGERERWALERLTFRRRRAEWRVGRWAAKQTLVTSGLAPAETRLDDLEVLAAADGAPGAWIGGRRLDAALSISHRDGAAAALVCGPDRIAGCDLELIEPRSPSFASDWFTGGEMASLEGLVGPGRDRLVTMIWSAKESALKAVHQGLRLDTREVEITSGRERPDREGWMPFVASIQGRDLSGWWRDEGHWLMTAVVADTAGLVEEKNTC